MGKKEDFAAQSLAKIKWRTAPAWDASPAAPRTAPALDASPAAPYASNSDEQRRFANLDLAEYAAQGHYPALTSLSALSSAAARVKLEEKTSGTLVRSKSWTLFNFQPDASAATEQKGAQKSERRCSVHGQEALPEPPRADAVVTMSGLQDRIKTFRTDLDYDSETTSEGGQDEDKL